MTKDFTISQDLRTKILKTFNNLCQECKQSGLRLDIHHIIPREFGGTNKLDNLIPLCRSCHKKIENSLKTKKFDDYNPKSQTVIRVKGSTYKRLLGYGKMGDSFDKVLNLVLDEATGIQKYR